MNINVQKNKIIIDWEASDDKHQNISQVKIFSHKDLEEILKAIERNKENKDLKVIIIGSSLG